MSELDAAALERSSSPAVELLGLRTLRTDGAGSAVSGFDAFSRLYVSAAAAEFRPGSRSDAVTVTVEQSADGLSWTEAAAFTFTSGGVQFATIDSPADQLRVSWVISGQLRSCRLVGVTATPGSLDAPGGAGGALPAGGTTGEVLTKASNADGDADWEASPGGGSTARETVFGNAVSIANNASASLTWDDVSSGPDSLIDNTTPDAPTFITAGVYAVSVSVGPASQLTATGYFFATLFIDPGNADAEVSATSPSASAASLTPYVALACTFYAPAGTVLSVNIVSKDGAATRNFLLGQANIQQLS